MSPLDGNSKKNKRAAWALVYLGLGSNLGDREANILKAYSLIESHPDFELLRTTDLIETEPWGPVPQPPFFNSIAKIKTILKPHPLLRLLKEWELLVGRKPGGVRYGPRILDIDILLYGDLIVQTPELIIPHARIAERQFILRQLVELDADLVHPLTGRLFSDFVRL